MGEGGRGVSAPKEVTQVATCFRVNRGSESSPAPVTATVLFFPACLSFYPSAKHLLGGLAAKKPDRSVCITGRVNVL